MTCRPINRAARLTAALSTATDKVHMAAVAFAYDAGVRSTIESEEDEICETHTSEITNKPANPIKGGGFSLPYVAATYPCDHE